VLIAAGKTIFPANLKDLPMHLGNLLRRMANDHVAGIRRELDRVDRITIDDEERRPSRERGWLIRITGVTVLLAQSIEFFVDLNDPFLLDRLRLAIKNVSHTVPHDNQGFDRIKQLQKGILEADIPRRTEDENIGSRLGPNLPHEMRLRFLPIKDNGGKNEREKQFLHYLLPPF
jgi:hypothetical protein